MGTRSAGTARRTSIQTVLPFLALPLLAVLAGGCGGSENARGTCDEVCAGAAEGLEPCSSALILGRTDPMSVEQCRADCAHDQAAFRTVGCGGQFDRLLGAQQGWDPGDATCEDEVLALIDCVRAADLAEIRFTSWKPPRTDGLHVIAARPLVAGVAGPEPRCAAPAGEVIGAELVVDWTRTVHDERCGTRDPAVRPGDVVETARVRPGETLGADSFTLALDCVEPYPDPDLVGPRECQGKATPASAITAVGWESFEPADADACEPASVVLLVDQSGSLRGFVDAENGWREGALGAFPIPGDSERAWGASDPVNSRLSAALDFVHHLRESDRLLVMSFHEGEAANLQVLCSEEPLPDTGDLAPEPEWVRQGLACFGADRGLVTAELARAFGDEGGRTPLWEAVAAAIDFLERDDVAATPNRHVVVIGDGPDTCSATSPAFVPDAFGACSGTSYEQVEARAAAASVHVHFVQLQSRGYAGHDLQQMALACRTRGTYQFVNALDAPRTASGVPESVQDEALSEALRRAARALRGTWLVQAAAEDLAAALNAPETVYGLSGTLALVDPDFVSAPEEAVFAPGDAFMGEFWDGRALLPTAPAD